MIPCKKTISNSHHMCMIATSFLLRYDLHLLSPMGAYGHPNVKPSVLFGSVSLACTQQLELDDVVTKLDMRSACIVQAGHYHSPGHTLATSRRRCLPVTSVVLLRTPVLRNTRWCERRSTKNPANRKCNLNPVLKDFSYLYWRTFVGIQVCFGLTDATLLRFMAPRWHKMLL